MGGTNFSGAAFKARREHVRSTGGTHFEYDRHVRETGRVEVHKDMNPYGVKVRESRDSDVHPESNAIAVLFDVTGSMREIPVTLQEKLGNLMQTLLNKTYVPHPQIMFGGIGDAFSDRVPLQVGQFESGNEMDDDLAKFVLEGGGGGGITESYEMALWFMANRTSIDCLEKRGRKGYLFTIGDEVPYECLKKEHAAEFLGETALQADVPLEEIVRGVQAKYEWFHVIPTTGAKGQDHRVVQKWKDLLGQNALWIDDPAAICELIAMTIGIAEGHVLDPSEGVTDLVNVGNDEAAAKAASTALTPYARAAGRTPAKRVAGGTVPAAGSGDEDAGRL